VARGAVPKAGDDGCWSVTKRELADSLQTVMGTGRLKVTNVSLADVLKKGLLNFKIKINANTGHESFEAWREGQHDDLCFAVLLPIW
jgi:hypothetical protein